MLSSYLSHDTFAHMQIFTTVSWSIKWTCFSEGILYTRCKKEKKLPLYALHLAFRAHRICAHQCFAIWNYFRWQNCQLYDHHSCLVSHQKNNHWFYSILLFFLILVHHDTVQHAALGGPVTYSSKKRSGFMPWGSCVNRRQRPLLKTTDAYMISTYLLKYIGRKLQTETPEIWGANSSTSQCSCFFFNS